MTGNNHLVVVGASWGGLDSLRTLFAGLPRDFGAPAVVVQHRSAESHPTAFRELLGAVTPLAVCEASDKQPLEPGRLYLAPPDYHTLVEGDHLALSMEAAVGHSRPSIDVLFESAAESRRERCVGIVLTGANDDGARGLARIVELGGTAIVEDPATAERAEMPRAALNAVPTARVTPVEEMPALLMAICSDVGVSA
jgi:two-component system, chemotaxis family, protein-glutamate methylesterase/glutaminase